METNDYVKEGLEEIGKWLRTQTEARLDSDVASAMHTVRTAIAALGAFTELTEICDRTEESLKEKLRDPYLRRAAEALFKRVGGLQDTSR